MLGLRPEYVSLGKRILHPFTCKIWSVLWGVANDWNFVGHLWNYFWKMKYGLKILIINLEIFLKGEGPHLSIFESS